jgi:hypothetical protein
MHHDRNNGKDQKDMDEESADMEECEAANPTKYEDKGKDQEHGICFLEAGGLRIRARLHLVRDRTSLNRCL